MTDKASKFANAGKQNDSVLPFWLINEAISARTTLLLAGFVKKKGILKETHKPSTSPPKKNLTMLE